MWIVCCNRRHGSETKPLFVFGLFNRLTVRFDSSLTAIRSYGGTGIHG